MTIQWTPDLATGNEQIDTEHKELISAIGRLLIATSAGKGKEEIASLLDFLLDYTKTHFAHEEVLQRNAHYPDVINHKRYHTGFIKEVDNLRRDYQTNSTSSVFLINVNKKVVGWLTAHIKVEDVKVAKHIRSQS